MTSLVELEPFLKAFGKTIYYIFFEWMKESKCPMCPYKMELVVHVK